MSLIDKIIKPSLNEAEQKLLKKITKMARRAKLPAVQAAEYIRVRSHVAPYLRNQLGEVYEQGYQRAWTDIEALLDPEQGSE